ncbi:uncharacterized protein KD926_011579 [Aspergillus affinis]|uniref:uncharacterized protein n=1 Tax=Aspergillus affinis TaxID=1070780 RepID=UPI0022FE6B9D|nr:uncharacterized protein KD926_011579 [Aspergillus affinis]KAI9037790.1 hypothetical protein KD926_011579 [Aspergillus affinis]
MPQHIFSPGERIVLRAVDGLLFLRPSGSDSEPLVVFAFGDTREDVLASLQATRNLTWEAIAQQSYAKSRQVLGELKLSGWNPTIHQLLERSSLVLDLLTNRETGGLIAGPDVHSGIESAPGYAAVWGSDAASGDLEFIKKNWSAIARAANFLLFVSEKEEFPSVDLWEERDGYHLYTVASTIAGLRSAAHLALAVQLTDTTQIERWKTATEAITAKAANRFWDQGLGRFVASVQVSSGLPMVDKDRPELSAKVQDGRNRPTTSLPSYPNWRDAETETTSIRHDVSVLSMAVPSAILPLDDPQVVSSVVALKGALWNNVVGGYCRYEGDSYDGGNPWPLATLWLAIYKGAQGNLSESKQLVEWVAAHTTPAGLVPEKVHHETGDPVAAVPLS